MQVIYLRGNHDDVLDEVLPLTLGNFSILRNHIHQSGDKKYFVVHGDIFDSVTTKLKWIARLGDTGYTFLLWLNRHYNDYRRKKGLPYYSLSQVVKAKVKQAVSFISDYEKELCAVAENEKCDGVICGHIHQADNKYIGNIHYLNSGDWVETLSAIVETVDHEWKIVYYQEWLKFCDASNSETVVSADSHINDFPNFEAASLAIPGFQDITHTEAASSINAYEDITNTEIRSSFIPACEDITDTKIKSSPMADFQCITSAEAKTSAIHGFQGIGSDGKASSGPKFESKHLLNAVYEDK